MRTFHSTLKFFISRHSHGVWVLSLCINFLVFIVISLIFPQSILQAGPSDGFYRLIQSVLAEEEHILKAVHTLRFYIIYPLYIMDVYEYYFLQCILAAVIAFPVIFILRREAGNIIVPLIIHSLFFVSMRTYISACGFAYLFIILRSGTQHDRLLFLASVIFSILSSGVLAVWAFVTIIFRRRLRSRIGFPYYFGIAVSLLVLSTSISHKAVFFFHLSSPPDQEREGDIEHDGRNLFSITNFGTKFIVTVISRNSLFQSIQNEDYSKILRYAIFLAILLVSTAHAFRSGDNIGIFFLAGIVAVLVEGLAFASYYMAGSLYMITAVLPNMRDSAKSDDVGAGPGRRAIGADQTRQGQLRS